MSALASIPITLGDASTVCAERLFDSIAPTYRWACDLSSLGTVRLLRRRCVREARIEPGWTVCDLATGGGECEPYIRKALRGRGHLIGLDISRGMLRRNPRRSSRGDLRTTLLHADFLENRLAARSVDSMVCGFGAKSFSPAGQEGLGTEIDRILKPGGTFSLIELSVPRDPLLRRAWFFWLETAVPGIAGLSGADAGASLPERACGTIRDCSVCWFFFEARIRGGGFQMLGGCVTGIRGRKPVSFTGSR